MKASEYKACKTSNESPIYVARLMHVKTIKIYRSHLSFNCITFSLSDCHSVIRLRLAYPYQIALALAGLCCGKIAHLHTKSHAISNLKQSILPLVVETGDASLEKKLILKVIQSRKGIK